MVKKHRKTKKNPRRSGAICGYEPQWDIVAYNMCAGGARDKELCVAFKVTKKTLQRWKRKFPSFGNAVYDGKDSFDGDRIESALIKRALGYSYEEVTRERVFVKEPGFGGQATAKMVVTKRVVKNMAPETKAIQLFLNARRSFRYPKVSDKVLSGPIVAPPKVEIEITHVETKPKDEGHGRDPKVLQISDKVQIINE